MRTLAKTARERGALQIVELDRPSPGFEDVLIAVEYAGLCGSDAGIYTFEDAYDRMDLPTVIGHEYTGRVVEVGDGVTSVEPGQRVVERPIRGCGDCHFCRSGQSTLCDNAAITGVDHDGAYSQFIVAPDDSLNIVPDDGDARHAAAVEPTGVAIRAVTCHSRVKAGSKVFVLGPGPIGLLTAQVADVQGGDVVVAGVSTDREHRLPLADELGFETTTVDDHSEVSHDERTTDIGYDVVFDTTGHPSGLSTAVEAVRKGGQIVVIGLPGETTVSYSPLVRSEVDVQCTYASDWKDFERAIELIRAGAVALDPLLDDRFSLEAADEAFEAFLAGETCKPIFDIAALSE